jgi:lactosylceramide 4-alpha-galactosyltransferase
MIQIRKKLKWIISINCFLFLTYCLFCDSNENLKKNNIFCVDNGLAVSLIPGAAGIFMDPNIPLVRWKTYEEIGETNLRIFFHETSGSNNLSFIQCCSVESAAKHHPNRPVQLFVRPLQNCFNSSLKLSPTSFFNPTWLKVLSKYPNLSVILLNERNYFFGTLMEDWYNKNEWRKSKFETAHLSDYLRILSLYKGGGLYLDLDVLTLKPYMGALFHNFLVYGSSRMDHISNGVMHFEIGHWMSKEIMQVLANEYDPESYIYHGPDAVGEVMKNLCGLKAGNPLSNQCHDIQLLTDNIFYPIPSIISSVLFQENENITQQETLAKIKKSFGLHWWNSLSRLHRPINMHSNQIITLLAHEHCPITVSMATHFESN